MQANPRKHMDGVQVCCPLGFIPTCQLSIIKLVCLSLSTSQSELDLNPPQIISVIEAKSQI